MATVVGRSHELQLFDVYQHLETHRRPNQLATPRACHPLVVGAAMGATDVVELCSRYLRNYDGAPC